MYPAVFHDNAEILLWLVHEGDILKWVDIDHEYVCERTFLHQPELARIGIAQIGKGKKLGICRGRQPQYLSALELPAAKMREHGALPRGHLRRE